MKTKILKLTTMALLLIQFLLFGCSSKDEQQFDLVQNTVFDSLQGEWLWYSTYDPKKGIIENDFESAIRFLSMNSDSTINYETYKDGTLEKKGKLKIAKTDWGRKIEPDILPHYNVTNENYFEFIGKDTLKLFELFEDRYDYFYFKNK